MSQTQYTRVHVADVQSARVGARTASTIITLTFAAICAGATSSARAASLIFDSTPVTDAVAMIDKTCHADIVIKPGVNPDRVVTFSVADVEQPGSRLEAVSMLANAVGANFQKMFIVRKVEDGDTQSDPEIDDPNASVYFQTAEATSEDAIRTVASVDDATVQFYSPIHGTISFPHKRMTADAAARQIAHETHTVWKSYYTLVPKTSNSEPSGKIVGYTNAGQPIIELPIMTFETESPKPPAPLPTAKSDKPEAAPSSKTAAGSGPDGAGAQQQAGLPPENAGQNNYPPSAGYMYPNGAYPGYNYPGYNSSGYGYPQYGYPGYGNQGYGYPNYGYPSNAMGSYQYNDPYGYGANNGYANNYYGYGNGYPQQNSGIIVPGAGGYSSNGITVLGNGNGGGGSYGYGQPVIIGPGGGNGW